jgi:methionyl-tRNA synthetase
LLSRLPTRVLPYEPLLTRIDPTQVAAMTEASKEDLKPAAPVAGAAKSTPDAVKPAATHAAQPGLIGIDDFARLDLRIGTVLECAFVEGSDKLLRFKLDAGDLGQRQIFSGIRAGYPDPAVLVGRQVVFIANLAPRKMRFGISEGMILSAGGDDGLFLLGADNGAIAGMSVK